MRSQSITVLVIVFLLLPAVGRADGKVISIEGEALRAVSDSAQPQPLKYGEQVRPGEILVTGAGGKVKVFFDDRSIITLGPNSRLKITKQLFDASTKKRETLFNLAKGKLRVLVPKLKRIFESRFEVATPNAVAGVRGTYFLAVAGNVEKFYSLEGKLTITQDGRSVELPPRTSLSVKRGTGVEAPKPEPLTDAEVEELEAETSIKERPNVIANERRDVNEKPPSWLPPSIDVGPPPGADFAQQFAGNDPSLQGPPSLPPIAQQPPTATGGSTSVNVTINSPVSP